MIKKIWHSLMTKLHNKLAEYHRKCSIYHSKRRDNEYLKTKKLRVSRYLEEIYKKMKSGEEVSELDKIILKRDCPLLYWTEFVEK